MIEYIYKSKRTLALSFIYSRFSIILLVYDNDITFNVLINYKVL